MDRIECLVFETAEKSGLVVKYQITAFECSMYDFGNSKSDSDLQYDRSFKELSGAVQCSQCSVYLVLCSLGIEITRYS